MSIFLSQRSKAFKASSLNICLIGIFLSSFFLEISEYINESSKLIFFAIKDAIASTRNYKKIPILDAPATSEKILMSLKELKDRVK